jgi:hypothetical protein
LVRFETSIWAKESLYYRYDKERMRSGDTVSMCSERKPAVRTETETGKSKAKVVSEKIFTDRSGSAIGVDAKAGSRSRGFY